MITGTGREEVKGDPPVYVTPGRYLRVPANCINRFSCSEVCTSFVYSSAMFDIHYVDAAGKEIPRSEAEKIAGMEKQESAVVGQTAHTEFRELIERYYTEWSTLDPDNAAPRYSKDADLVFFDLAPLKYTGWEEYRVGVKKAFFDRMLRGR